MWTVPPGDPLFSDAEGPYDPQTDVPLAASDRVFGENTDGTEMFNVGGRDILVVNHEYTNRDVNLP